MKNRGSEFEYVEERNNDLMNAYLSQLAACNVIRLPQIFNNVVNMPSSRFWVSAERAAIVISNMMRGDTIPNMRKTKREMFYEIYRRVIELRALHPNKSIYELALIVVQSPAPKFYLTAGSAKVIIYRIKKQWFEKRKRKFHRIRKSQ